MNTKLAAVALACILGTGSLSAAFAHGPGELAAIETIEAYSVIDPIVTPDRAVTAAEAQFGGEAFGVSSLNRNGQLVYDVALFRIDGATQDVWVYANGEMAIKSGALNIDDNPHIERDRKRIRDLDDETRRADLGDA
jgi:hypothetical protein